MGMATAAATSMAAHNAVVTPKTDPTLPDADAEIEC
jgi:hypothetical protein